LAAVDAVPARRARGNAARELAVAIGRGVDHGRVSVTVAFFGVFFWMTDLVFGRLYLYVSNYFQHH